MNRSNGGGSWIIFAVLAVACALIFGGTGGFGSALLKILGISAAVLFALVAVILVIAFKVGGEKTGNGTKTALSEEDAAVLAQGRKDLTELRLLNVKLKETEIREKSNAICGTVEKILSTLKDKPDQILSAQMFLRYYLPTQKSILQKYQDIESSGVDTEGETKAKVSGYLDDIAAAMKEQYTSLYQDTIIDLSAEMEVMTRSARRDGLL